MLCTFFTSDLFLVLAYHDELFLAFPGIRSLNRKSWNVGHALHEK